MDITVPELSVELLIRVPDQEYVQDILQTMVDQCIHLCLQRFDISPISLSIAFEVYGMLIPISRATLANVTIHESCVGEYEV